MLGQSPAEVVSLRTGLPGGLGREPQPLGRPLCLHELVALDGLHGEAADLTENRRGAISNTAGGGRRHASPRARCRARRADAEELVCRAFLDYRDRAGRLRRVPVVGAGEIRGMDRGLDEASIADTSDRLDPLNQAVSLGSAGPKGAYGVRTSLQMSNFFRFEVCIGVCTARAKTTTQTLATLALSRCPASGRCGRG